MASARFSSARVVAIVAAIGCAKVPANSAPLSAVSPASDTVEARRVFEENIDAIHKRDRARYLATYIHIST
ncbi:MAG TPA: hypothetical protein VEM14_08090, partial [Gemmatimonadaceae bacterium]|nr:hypothetical protein [Gemmatimonadaceae bacterium]